MTSPFQIPLEPVPVYPRAAIGLAKSIAIADALNWHDQQRTLVRNSAAGKEWAANFRRSHIEPGVVPYDLLGRVGAATDPYAQLDRWARYYVDAANRDPSLSADRVQYLAGGLGMPQPDVVPDVVSAVSQPGVVARAVARFRAFVDFVTGAPVTETDPAPPEASIFAARQWLTPQWITDPTAPVAERRKALLDRLDDYAAGEADAEFAASDMWTLTGRRLIGHYRPVADALNREICSSVAEQLFSPEEALRAKSVLEGLCRKAEMAAEYPNPGPPSEFIVGYDRGPDSAAQPELAGSRIERTRDGIVEALHDFGEYATSSLTDADAAKQRLSIHDFAENLCAAAHALVDNGTITTVVAAQLVSAVNAIALDYYSRRAIEALDSVAAERHRNAGVDSAVLGRGAYSGVAELTVAADPDPQVQVPAPGLTTGM